MLTSLSEYFFQQLFCMAKFCMEYPFTQLWGMAILRTNISQGSVATCLRCDGIFNYWLTRNLLLSLPVKEFWKSVSIWHSYTQK